MHGIERHGPVAEVEDLGQFPHRRDLVRRIADLNLSEHQTAAVLHRSHQHSAPVLGERLGRAADLFAVHRHGRPFAQVLRGPILQDAVQRLGRQRRQDVAERRGRRRRIALPARAPESPHRAQLVLVQQGRKLAHGGDPAIAGQPGRDRNRQIAGQRIALPASLAEVRNLAEKLRQRAQRRRRHRLAFLPELSRRRLLLAAEHIAGIRP